MTVGVLAIFVGLMAGQWAVESQVEGPRRAASVPDEVRLGDFVLCEKTYSWLGDALSPEPPPEADRRLLTMAEQAARGASLRYTLGDVLTLGRAGADPPSRERGMKLGEMAVVDAGGYVVAEAVRDRGVPFLAVRVSLGRVVDVASEALSLAAGRGHLRPGRAALHYLPRPHKAPAFIRLAVGIRKATRRLASFTGPVLRERGPEA